MGTTYTGRVIGTPTVHHVTDTGNAAKQFIVISEDGLDARVLVTAGNAQLGYTIGNSTFRALPHVFHLNARGKVTHAEPVDVDWTLRLASELHVNDRIMLPTGRWVTLDYVNVSSDGGAVTLGYANIEGVSEKTGSQAWDNTYRVATS